MKTDKETGKEKDRENDRKKLASSNGGAPCFVDPH